MQLVTSKRLLSQDNLPSNIDIKNQIESMHALQTNLLNIFQQSEKQLQRKHSKLKEVTKMSSTQAGKIKQLLDSFAYQCKNEWVMIWQQFFSLFQRIVDLYQLKIGKLQEKIVQKDACIQNLRLQQKPSESNSKQAQFALFDYKQHRQIQNSITKEEESGLFSEKMQKRVKISDVIAEYNQGKSVSSNMANSFAEAVTEENDQSESDQAGAPKVLMEIADQLNRQTLSYKFSRFSDRHHAQRLGDNYCEMSAILSGQSSHRISPVKQSKAKKHSLRTSKENSLFYSKKAKESEDIKKRNSYLIKNLKSYESQVLNPGGKLDELRKNLLQRKKSEHIL